MQGQNSTGPWSLTGNTATSAFSLAPELHIPQAQSFHLSNLPPLGSAAGAPMIFDTHLPSFGIAPVASMASMDFALSREEKQTNQAAENKRCTDEADIKSKADEAQARLNKAATCAREAAERLNRIIGICREGHLMGVPALLGALSNIQFFEELGIQPIAVAPNAEVRDAIRLLLIAERNRRLPEAGEDAELAYVWFGDEADPAPAAGAAMGAGQ